MTGLPSADCFLMGGLVLDIVGVIALAVPDIPRVARFFKFGKLRAARNALQYGGLEPGDTGFEQVVAIHSRDQPNVEITPDLVEYIEYGPQVTRVTESHDVEVGGTLIPPFTEDDILGYDVDFRVNFRFSDEYPRELDFQIGRESKPPGRVYAKINQSIEQGERTWRVLGVVIIAVGFASQLAAAVVG